MVTCGDLAFGTRFFPVCSNRKPQSNQFGTLQGDTDVNSMYQQPTSDLKRPQE